MSCSMMKSERIIFYFCSKSNFFYSFRSLEYKNICHLMELNRLHIGDIWVFLFGH